MDINEFIGLPYREGARGPEAYDCYGVVMAVYRAGLGIELPDWYADAPGPQGASRAIAAAMTDEATRRQSVKVEAAEDFDIAVVGSSLRPHHVGVFMHGGVLHCSKAFGSVWQQMPRFTALYPSVEFYRWHR